jgi:hypothetical protein
MTPVAALQSALAAEHAALYLFGAYGARTSQSADPALYAAVTEGYLTHRARRDHLEQVVTARGEEPVPAAPTYRLPDRLATAPQVTASALATERTAAAGYAALVASTVDADRRWAVEALTASAVLQLRLGGRPEAFPGADELGG